VVEWGGVCVCGGVGGVADLDMACGIEDVVRLEEGGVGGASSADVHLVSGDEVATNFPLGAHLLRLLTQVHLWHRRSQLKHSIVSTRETQGGGVPQ